MTLLSMVASTSALLLAGRLLIALGELRGPRPLEVEVARAALPSAAVLLGGLFIVTYVPFFSLALLGGG